MENVRVIQNACQVCYCDCGMLVYERDGEIIKVEGDPENIHNRGVLCAQGRAARQVVYAPDRIKTPLMKVKADGETSWEEITWDEALDTIAGKLKVIKEEHGPESFVITKGPMRPLQEGILGRLAYSYGTPNVTGNWAYCVGSKVLGYKYTFGPAWRGDSWMPWSDFRNSKAILLFGTNPAVSFIHRYPRIMGDILDAKRDGAKLIVVDPRFTETASKADIYVPIKPGTDAAMVLAMINVIISENLYDKEYVEKHTVGFEELKEHVKSYTPEYAEGITGVPAETILEVARIFGSTRPASLDRREGVIHHTNSTHTNRAMAILLAITGNADVKGGLLFNPSVPLASINKKERLGDVKAIWSEDYPLTVDGTGLVADAILTEKPYPVKAMMVVGANPVQQYPNTNKVKKALEKLDMLVVIDLFMTETAKMADIVLPASTFFEKEEICHSIHLALNKFLQVSKRVIEPMYDTKPEWWMFCQLGKRLGLEGFEFESEDEIIELLLEPMGIKRSDLPESGVYSEPIEVGKLLSGGFNTASGKIELYSKPLEELGYEPLPSYVEPLETAKSRPDLAGEYPLTLITGSKLAVYHHSQQRNVPWLREHAPDPLVEINTETAKSLGIEDGDRVIVKTIRGEAEFNAYVTLGIHRDVVSITHGWGGKANVNYLTDDKQVDPVSVAPGLRTLLCKVQRMEG